MSGLQNETHKGKAEQNNVTPSSKYDERVAPEGLFVATRAVTGWRDGDECDAVIEIDPDWNGLISDDDDDVPALLLDVLASPSSLWRLNLSCNERGRASPEFGRPRELASADVFRNRFKGRVEIAFGQMTVHADYGRNWSTLAGFWRFSIAYTT
eukprot:CAMPEP_0172571744 /NCGR_PEP_ID=MMETSP1067-20121228/132379_1 /TAXON_ID=265564 ORGANISM="Thalassiosira punctigera, Strain Tpunct2005C2" /NCGR_SAMPLE_ID=MMETSP1067 /ASSEMBLY_ACC=CAM_ASM_000444 /LENGTH=153 /DNA_ID=CAMNT_0013364145 /DNA_START=344 /DNA_END=802 /DNA_ORIENTATION=+